jgi:hypothetical protein
MPGSDRDEVTGDPFDTAAIDRLDAAAILAGYWSEDEEVFAEDEEFRAMLAPFGPHFPGLAAAIAAEVDPELMRRALYQYTRDARMGLVAARSGVHPSLPGSQRPGPTIAVMDEEWRVSIALDEVPRAERKSQMRSFLTSLRARLGDQASISGGNERIFVYTSTAASAATGPGAGLSQKDLASTTATPRPPGEPEWAWSESARWAPTLMRRPARRDAPRRVEPR